MRAAKRKPRNKDADEEQDDGRAAHVSSDGVDCRTMLQFG
jgi:hypothetical protein